MNLSPAAVPSTEMAVTEDRLLGGRVRLLQPQRGYRVAVDAVLLAASVGAGPAERVLDLGAGAGAVGLCLAARLPGCEVVGLELQKEMTELARRNAQLNGCGDRVRTIVHDLAAGLPPGMGQFDWVVTNPPYLAAEVADPPPDRAKALATVESSAKLEHFLGAAAGAAKPAGTVALVHRSDRLDEILSGLRALGWNELVVKRLPPAARVLVRARRATQASLREAVPLQLHGPDGCFTQEADAVLRRAAALVF